MDFIYTFSACMEHIDTAVDAVTAPIHKPLKGLEESHEPDTTLPRGET